MTNEQFFEIKLPKWPCLIVVGKPITRDQAKSVLIRTDPLNFVTNDHVFANELFELVYGVKSKETLHHSSLYSYFITENGYNWQSIQKCEDRVKKELGIIPLNYMHNRQIVSSWVGGAHGWCKWSGLIFTNNYNIGKWPSVESVYNDWCEIAKAFPFLDLKSQLLSGESCDDNLKPLITFIIKNGKVKMSKLKHILVYPTRLEDEIKNFFLPNKERGCTIETVKDAIEYVKNEIRMAGISKPQSTP